MITTIAPKYAESLTWRELALAIDDEGILVRTGDKGIEIVAPQSLKERILYINHESLLAGHLGGRKRLPQNPKGLPLAILSSPLLCNSAKVSKIRK